MSFAEIMSQVIAGKISQDEATRLAGELESVQRKSGSLDVRRNKSGGVYIRHPSFVEFSKEKKKNYVAGINLPPNVAKVIFSEDDAGKQLREEIGKAVASLPA